MELTEKQKKLKYFVDLMKEGKIIYVNGRLFRTWEQRRGWLEKPVKAEKECSNKYFTVRSRIGKNEYCIMAHRLIYSYFNDVIIPDGLEINHIDANKQNNKIENLELVTRKENLNHAKRMGLLNPPKEFDNHNCKLSDDDVYYIRALLNYTDITEKELADYYHVNENQINRIKNKKRRCNLKPFTINKYQEMSKATLNTELSKEEQLKNYVMGLSGEAGEVLDYVKKCVYHGHKFNPEKLFEELGDVLFYVNAIATTLNIDMAEICVKNKAKLIKRYPHGRFRAQDSINRVV